MICELGFSSHPKPENPICCVVNVVAFILILDISMLTTKACGFDFHDKVGNLFNVISIQDTCNTTTCASSTGS